MLSIDLYRHRPRTITHETFTVSPEDCDSPMQPHKSRVAYAGKVQRSPGYLINCMLSHLSGSTWYIKCTVLDGCNRLSPLVYAILVQAHIALHYDIQWLTHTLIQR